MKYEEVLLAIGITSETDNKPQCIHRLLKVLTWKGGYWLYNKSSIPYTLKRKQKKHGVLS